MENALSSQPHATPQPPVKAGTLLTVWLLGLMMIETIFLMAATNMDLHSWQSGALTIAAIINVPLFLGAYFLLQK